MTTNVITFKANQEIMDVTEKIIQKKISGAPVVNNKGEIVGIITEKDCLRVIYDEKYHNLFPNQGKATNSVVRRLLGSAEREPLDDFWVHSPLRGPPGNGVWRP